MRSHAIACDCMRSRKKTFLSQQSKFLKMHREQEAGQKVCLTSFFTTTVNRFHLLFFSPFSKRKKWEAGLILHSNTCFFCSQLSWRNTSGRIFSPVSPKQVPNVFLPAGQIWRGPNDGAKGLGVGASFMPGGGGSGWSMASISSFKSAIDVIEWCVFFITIDLSLVRTLPFL